MGRRKKQTRRPKSTTPAASESAPADAPFDFLADSDGDFPASPVTDALLEEAEGIDDFSYSDAALRLAQAGISVEQRIKDLAAVMQAAEFAKLGVSAKAVETNSLSLEKDEREFLQAALPAYGNFELIRRGGQGAVYKARQLSTGRSVAIKMLLDGPLAGHASRRRIDREADLLAQLRHPNIVTLYDTGVVRGRRYLVMEFIKGVALNQYLRDARASIQEIVGTFLPVCRAVAHAHQHGIIHRDLKPSNVLVGLDCQPRVCDFGLAKHVEEGFDTQSLTLSGHVIGTLAYLSPEAADERDDEVEVRSDIYSLGVVLYELLTGTFPYKVDGAPKEICRNIINCEPRRPSLARRGAGGHANPIPRELETIVMTALSKEKARRYQSASEMADDLQRFMEGGIIQARAQSGLYVLRKTLRRYRVATAIVAGFLVLAMASGVVITSLWLQARRDRDHAVAAGGLTRATLSRLLRDVEKIRSLAGGTELCDELLASAFGTLRELKHQAHDDPELDGVLALLEEKQGDSDLTRGDGASAYEHYGNSMTARFGASHCANLMPSRMPDLIRLSRKRASLSDSAENDFETALALCDAGIGVGLDRAVERQIQVESCRTRVDFGKWLYQRGQHLRAAQQVEGAIVLAGHEIDAPSDGDDWQEIVASGCELDSDIRRQLGGSVNVQELMERAVAMRRAMSKSRLADTQRRFKLMTCLVRLGAMYGEGPQTNRSIQILTEAVRTGEFLCTAEPGVPRWKFELASACNRLSRQYQSIHDGDLSREYANRADALMEELSGLSIRDSIWRRAMGMRGANQGFALRAMGRADEAANRMLDAVCYLEEVVGEDPENPDNQAVLTIAHSSAAGALLDSWRLDECQYHRQAAFRRAQALLLADADVVKRALDVIDIEVNMAGDYIERRRPAATEIAGNLLDAADCWLTDLAEAGLLTGQELFYQTRMDGIATNKRIVKSRRERLAALIEAPSNTSNETHE